MTRTEVESFLESIGCHRRATVPNNWHYRAEREKAESFTLWETKQHGDLFVTTDDKIMAVSKMRSGMLRLDTGYLGVCKPYNDLFIHGGQIGTFTPLSYKLKAKETP